MKIRGSGILLHITSLPSRYGIGDLGPGAFRFADFLEATGQKYWQILPLNPTDPAYDDNPYHSISAFANNPLLISPELMAEDGFVDASDIGAPETFPEHSVDFARVIPLKERIFTRAYERFAQQDDRRDFERFCRENAWWLDDFCLFAAIRSNRDGLPWNQWPEDLKQRKPDALETEREHLHERIEKIQFLQFVFMLQWQKLRKYCRDRGIHFIGDIPIYVDYDSADVWQHPEFFKLDRDLNPMVMAGVPPDYFSATGQLWHNPVYDWESLQKSGFSWWCRRMERNLALVDYVRIDHFRGLVACWEVPAGSDTAMDGKWVAAPAEELLHTFVRKFPCLPVIAEDLGVITPDVREVMEKFGIPGMKVLLFAFEEGFPHGPYLPHNAIRHCIFYTGTHDNNPVRGWIANEATEQHRIRIHQYFGREIPDSELNQALVRMAMATVANTVIIPLQDLLGLDAASRMNKPGTDKGNWKWRFSERMLIFEAAENLRSMTTVYERD
jgi:4-alpha-glucanotransferase